MRIKRLAALSLAAVFTAAMLTGCPWDIEDDASSVTSSSSSSSISRPSYDDDEDEDDSSAGGESSSSSSSYDDDNSSADEESSSSSSSSEPEKPEPDPEDPETWQVSEDGSTLIVPSGATSEQITKNLFETHPNITSLDLRGSGVTTIDKDAFDGCINLQRVTMGDMDTIGSGAFDSCTSLQSVTMGDVTTIGEIAFVNCKNLHAVDMGVVRNIVRSAFGGCVNLTSIRFKNDTAGPSVASGAFQGVGVATGGVTVYSDWAVQNRDTVTSWFWPHLSPLQVYTNGYDALTFP